MVLLRHQTIREGAVGVHDGKRPRQFPVHNGYALVPDDLKDRICVTADWRRVTERAGDVPTEDELRETTGPSGKAKA